MFSRKKNKGNPPGGKGPYVHPFIKQSLVFPPKDQRRELVKKVIEDLKLKNYTFSFN